MSETTKTILIVGGVAVGVVVLFKALSPSPALAGGAKPPPKSITDSISVSGLVGLGTSLFNAFGGGSTATGAAHAPVLIDSPAGFVATRDEWQNIADYNAQPGTQYGIAGVDY